MKDYLLRAIFRLADFCKNRFLPPLFWSSEEKNSLDAIGRKMSYFYIAENEVSKRSVSRACVGVEMTDPPGRPDRPTADRVGRRTEDQSVKVFTFSSLSL
jgi:hypothetical protein